MNADLAVSLMMKTLEIALMIAAPMLIVGLAIGLIVSIFQAVTQIQEMTLSFIPKIIGMMIAGAIAGPWMLSVMIEYATTLLTNLPTYVGK